MLLKRFIAVFFLLASVASADIVGYDVSMDTSSQSGNSGAIYFQFAPGLNADLATVTIDGFAIGAPGGLVSTPSPFFDGNVSGSLDSLTLTIDNSQGLNDYEEFLTYGPTLNFHITFDIPSVLVGQGGSAFVWQLTAADGLTPVLTQDNSGNIGTIAYDTSGHFTTDTLGNDLVESIVTTTPEPASIALITISVLLMGVKKFRGR
jgi:hypothetical protein